MAGARNQAALHVSFLSLWVTIPLSSKGGGTMAISSSQRLE
jgi:hypothetical protein